MTRVAHDLLSGFNVSPKFDVRANKYKVTSSIFFCFFLSSFSICCLVTEKFERHQMVDPHIGSSMSTKYLRTQGSMATD